MFPHSPENQPCPGLHQKKHVSGFMSKEPNSFSFWVAPSFLSYFSDENCMPRCGRTWSEKISPFPIATTLKHMKTNQTLNHMSSLSDRLSHLNPKSKRCGGLFSLNTVKNIRLCREHVTAPFSTNARKSSSHECKSKRPLALRYSSTISYLYCSLCPKVPSECTRHSNWKAKWAHMHKWASPLLGQQCVPQRP